MENNSHSKESSVKKYYNQFAENYDSMYQSIQYQKYKELNEQFGYSFEGWTLDHGGGTGLFSKWVGKQLITLDISIEMLRIGMKQYNIQNPICGDIQKVPFRNQSISTLYSFTSIQNASNPEKVFFEMKRMLQESCYGIVTILSKFYLEQYFDMLDNMFEFCIKIHLEMEDIAIQFSHGNSSSSSSGS